MSIRVNEGHEKRNMMIVKNSGIYLNQLLMR